MKTTTPDYVKWLRIAFLTLTALSLAELFGAALTNIPYLWGYSFIVVVAVIVLVYAVFGRPYFRMDSTTDIIEFENGFSMFNFLDKYLIVRKDMLREVRLEKGLFKRKLKVVYEDSGVLEELSFEISFLQKEQVEQILNNLQKAMDAIHQYNAMPA